MNQIIGYTKLAIGHVTAAAAITLLISLVMR